MYNIYIYTYIYTSISSWKTREFSNVVLLEGRYCSWYLCVPSKIPSIYFYFCISVAFPYGKVWAEKVMELKASLDEQKQLASEMSESARLSDHRCVMIHSTYVMICHHLSNSFVLVCLCLLRRKGRHILWRVHGRTNVCCCSFKVLAEFD